MLSARQAGAVVVWAPAKVNLYLEVLGKRPDGYHDIATFMVAVSLYDTLEFTEETSGKVWLDTNHPDLSTGPDNLVCRAATLLQRHCGCTKGACIRLVKRIPLAAGLAGGSTDAAAALAGLNRLWALGLGGSELAVLGADLGSDVPFFFSTPSAWCTGRGERVEPWPLKGPLWLVLVCPAMGLSTAEVYRGVTVSATPETGVAMRQAAAEGDLDEMARRLHNRLQPVAERLCPAVATWRSRLANLKPLGQQMSGSGTSVFALCRDCREAQRIARELRHGLEEDDRATVFLVRSCI